MLPDIFTYNFYMTPKRPVPDAQLPLITTPPRCPDCRIQARKELTNRARLDDIPVEDIGKYPGCLITIWTGAWFCPRCRRVVAGPGKNP